MPVTCQKNRRLENEAISDTTHRRDGCDLNRLCVKLTIIERRMNIVILWPDTFVSLIWAEIFTEYCSIYVISWESLVRIMQKNEHLCKKISIIRLQTHYDFITPTYDFHLSPVVKLSVSLWSFSLSTFPPFISLYNHVLKKLFDNRSLP